MLGGLGQLARPDAVSSLRFLSEFVTPPSNSSAASIVNPSSSKDTKITGTTTGSTTAKRQKLPLPGAGPSRVLDCGAGIGRVTKQVLIKAFDHVDLVENSAIFVKQAQEEYLKAEIESGKVCEVRCSGLQNVEFEGTEWEGRFDVIWCQWVLGHLTEGKHISSLLFPCSGQCFVRAFYDGEPFESNSPLIFTRNNFLDNYHRPPDNVLQQV